MKVILFIFFLIGSFNAYSCECGERDVRGYFSHYAKSYTGYMINAKVLENGKRNSATLKVSEKFKGSVYDLEEVVTDHSSCEAPFVVGRSYLVFEEENGVVHMCSMFIINPYHEPEIKLLRKLANNDT